MKFFLLSILYLISVVQNPLVSRRQIITDDYNFEFFIDTKSRVNCKKDRKYFWYKNGELHSSLGGVSGKVLDSVYVKYFVSNKLAEKGFFDKGLKNGEWKTWYENGNSHEIINWKQGIEDGKFFSFSISGKLVSSGKYLKGKKHGKWVNHLDKDTLYFRLGEKYIPKKKNKDGQNKSDEGKFTNKLKGYFKKVFKGKKEVKEKNKSSGKSKKRKAINKRKKLKAAKKKIKTEKQSNEVKK